MNRSEWQQLAEDRILDAQALLAAGRWSGAYHLSGYAVECGLKACVLTLVAAKPEVIFLQKRFSERCWTHDLEDLIDLADLQPIWDAAIAASKPMEKNWLIVKDWSEVSRYRQKTQVEAQALYDATTDNTNGVLPWIRVRW